MRVKKIVNIGDIFLSWKVTELVNPKKYRYKCRCTECGIEKEFVKYNLLKGTYAPCRVCGHKKLTNIPLLKKHWNTELNEAIFDNSGNLSLTKSYWFICNKGHNFKSSIKDFKLERCLGCIENPPNHPSKIEAKEYAVQLFSNISLAYPLDNFLIYLYDLNTFLYLIESDRFERYSNYFSSEKEMIEELEYTSYIRSKIESGGHRFVRVDLEKDLKKNVDIFKEVMILLTQGF